MGSALIELLRARFAPSGVSRSWSRALRPTEAERFVRQVSLRWVRAAAELEDLIRGFSRTSGAIPAIGEPRPERDARAR